MASAEYEVTRVDGSNTWQSQYGPMVAWSLACRNVQTGGERPVEINAKPGNEYKPGQKFWAEVKGERSGVVQLKRVQAPDGGGQYRGSGQGTGRAQTGSTGRQEPISFEKAVALLVECIKTAEAIGGTPEHGTTLYLGVTRGDIAWPPLDGTRAPYGNPEEGDFQGDDDDAPF